MVDATLAAPLALAADDAMRVAARPVDAELGGQPHLVAPVRDAPADQDLVVAGAVGIRRVEERDAAIERLANKRNALLVAAFAVHAGQRHAAKPDRGNLQARGTERTYGRAIVLTHPMISLTRPFELSSPPIAA